MLYCCSFFLSKTFARQLEKGNTRVETGEGKWVHLGYIQFEFQRSMSHAACGTVHVLMTEKVTK